MEDVEKVDVHSAEFASLPPELKHEILQERQELERHTYTDPGTLPHVASDFSDYQMSRLMKRSRLSRQLEDVRHSLKEMGSEIIGGQLGSFEVEANRIMSSDSAHYILVKGVDVEGSSSQDKLNDVMVGRDDVAGNETAELEMEEGRSDVIVCENDVVAEVEAEVVAEKEVKGAEDVSFNSLTAGGVCSSTTSVLDDIIHTAHEHTLPEEKEEEEEREKGPCVNVSTNEHQPTSDRKHAVVGAEPALKPTAKEDAIAAPISAKSPVSSEFLIPPPASANSPVSAKSTELPPASTVAESDSEVHPPEEVVGEMCDEGRGESGEVWEGGVLELSPREARSRLEEEVAELGREMERQRRAAAGIGSLVYREAQVRPSLVRPVVACLSLLLGKRTLFIFRSSCHCLVCRMSLVPWRRRLSVPILTTPTRHTAPSPTTAMYFYSEVRGSTAISSVRTTSLRSLPLKIFNLFSVGVNSL